MKKNITLMSVVIVLFFVVGVYLLSTKGIQGTAFGRTTFTYTHQNIIDPDGKLLGKTSPIAFGDWNFKAMGEGWYKCTPPQNVQYGDYISIDGQTDECWQVRVNWKNDEVLTFYSGETKPLTDHIKVTYYAHNTLEYDGEAYNFKNLNPVDDFKNEFVFELTNLDDILELKFPAQNNIFKLGEANSITANVKNDFAPNIEGGVFVLKNDTIINSQSEKENNFKLAMDTVDYPVIEINTNLMGRQVVSARPFIKIDTVTDGIIYILDDRTAFITYRVVENMDFVQDQSLACKTNSECSLNMECNTYTANGKTTSLCEKPSSKTMKDNIPTKVLIKTIEITNTASNMDLMINISIGAVILMVLALSIVLLRRKK